MIINIANLLFIYSLLIEKNKAKLYKHSSIENTFSTFGHKMQSQHRILPA